MVITLQDVLLTLRDLLKKVMTENFTLRIWPPIMLVDLLTGLMVIFTVILFLIYSKSALKKIILKQKYVFQEKLKSCAFHQKERKVHLFKIYITLPPETSPSFSQFNTLFSSIS